MRGYCAVDLKAPSSALRAPSPQGEKGRAACAEGLFQMKATVSWIMAFASIVRNDCQIEARRSPEPDSRGDKPRDDTCVAPLTPEGIEEVRRTLTEVGTL